MSALPLNQRGNLPLPLHEFCGEWTVQHRAQCLHVLMGSSSEWQSLPGETSAEWLDAVDIAVEIAENILVVGSPVFG